MTREEKLEQLKSLRALAADRCNPHESDNARRAADKLEAELFVHNPSPKPPPPEPVRKPRGGAAYPHQLTLLEGNIPSSHWSITLGRELAKQFDLHFRGFLSEDGEDGEYTGYLHGNDRESLHRCRETYKILYRTLVQGLKADLFQEEDMDKLCRLHVRAMRDLLHL